MNGNLDLDSNGNIKLSPLVGYETHVLAGMALLTRLSFVNSEEELKKGDFHNLQLLLTPAQCQELAAALLRGAATIEGQTVGKPQA